MIKLSDIFKYWPWDKPMMVTQGLLIIIAGFSLIFLLATNFSFLVMLSVLIYVLLVFKFYQYIKIFKNIEILNGCISAQNGSVCSTLIKLKQALSPGIAILREDLFILIPLKGRRKKVYFEKITAVNEASKMPGVLLFDKKIFNISLGENKTVSFALAKADAENWSNVFNSLPATVGQTSV